MKAQFGLFNPTLLSEETLLKKVLVMTAHPPMTRNLPQSVCWVWPSRATISFPVRPGLNTSELHLNEDDHYHDHDHWDDDPHLMTINVVMLRMMIVALVVYATLIWHKVWMDMGGGGKKLGEGWKRNWAGDKREVLQKLWPTLLLAARPLSFLLLKVFCRIAPKLWKRAILSQEGVQPRESRKLNPKIVFLSSILFDQNVNFFSLYRMTDLVKALFWLVTIVNVCKICRLFPSPTHSTVWLGVGQFFGPSLSRKYAQVICFGHFIQIVFPLRRGGRTSIWARAT